jgi:hypothetical protein
MVTAGAARACVRFPRIMVTLCGLCAALMAGWAVPLRAQAQENAAESPGDGRAVAAPVAGALTLFVPLLIGGALLAQDDDRALQRDAVRVMVAGFAAAPIVSHAVAGRWRRALVFGLVSAATSVATLVAMSQRDPFDPQMGNHQRLAFGVLFTASFFAGAGGVVDSFVVGPAPTAN